MSPWLSSTTQMDSGSSGYVPGSSGDDQLEISASERQWLARPHLQGKMLVKDGKMSSPDLEVECGDGRNPEGEFSGLAWTYRLGICEKTSF